MLDDLFRAGGPVMIPIAIASALAWWLALSCGLGSSHLLRDLRATRRWEGIRLGAALRKGDIELAVGEIARLHQSLRILAVLVGILPLLGLLGTVSGMIGTFGVIHSTGMGDPRLLAGGIREALFATETGLATALPALLFQQLIASRVRSAEGEEELLLRRLSRRAPDPSRFGEIAVRLGYVTSGDLDRCLPMARERGCRIGDALVSEGKLSQVQRRIVLSLQGKRHD